MHVLRFFSTGLQFANLATIEQTGLGCDCTFYQNRWFISSRAVHHRYSVSTSLTLQYVVRRMCSYVLMQTFRRLVPTEGLEYLATFSSRDCPCSSRHRWT